MTAENGLKSIRTERTSTEYATRKKAAVLNYGRSNMPARPWFTAANEKAADDVVSEMRRVWEEKQNEER